ncbi:hypothetical protein D9758_005305 [Tetrapyrgos nigripes]|uniref:HAT C-terminal dimerisation domain-containing protein n=1 Tax=Tetrapyrgos nigripes TaxID=182062 RepID=A0A8H5LWX3_9AGAR|nr:hypothetical protein D9758_005305 [Tetrapyrgos nigripes]
MLWEKQGWKWSTKAKGSTGNFIQHFKNSHGKVWAARSTEDEKIRHPNRTQAPGQGPPQKTLDSWADRAFDVEKANRLLSEWIVLSVAFTAPEHPAFRRYITHLRPGYGKNMIKGDAAKNHVSAEFKDAEKRLKEYLTFSALAADNASNNDTLREELASILNSASTSTFYDSDNITIRCLPHAIHLAVRAFLIELKACDEADIDPNNIESANTWTEEEAESVVAQDEGLSETSDEKLLEEQDDDGVDIKAVVQKAIDELCIRNDLYKKYRITNEEWEVLDIIVGFLEVFRKESERMSASSFPSLTASLMVYVKLMQAVDSFLLTDTANKNPSVRKGLEACKAKLEKYYDKSTGESEYYYAAAVLDPRVKYKLFDNNPSLFSNEWRQEMDIAFKDRIATYPRSSFSTATIPTVSSQPTTSQKTDDLFNDVSLLGTPASSTSAVETVEEEYASYIADREVDECLAFWKVKCTKYPRLAAYARDVLAIPGPLGSSVAVERSLSVGKDLIGLHRHSLGTDTTRELMMHRSILVFEGALREDYRDVQSADNPTIRRMPSADADEGLVVAHPSGWIRIRSASDPLGALGKRGMAGNRISIDFGKSWVWTHI